MKIKLPSYIYFTIGLFVFSAGFAFFERQYPINTKLEPETATLRMTTSGNILGYVGKNGAYTWKGIPYAQAPLSLIHI